MTNAPLRKRASKLVAGECIRNLLVGPKQKVTKTLSDVQTNGDLVRLVFTDGTSFDSLRSNVYSIESV